jgi:hypothetical protein
MKNLYEILQCKLSSSPDEIKQQFRRLAQKYHPDKNNNSLQSQLHFRNIYEAYEVLSNEQKRSEYNLLYAKIVKKQRQFEKPKQKPKVDQPYDPEDDLIVHRSIIDEFNYILWDVEDIIQSRYILQDRKKYNEKTIRQWVIEILVFLDKWILETSDHGDYFYQSRGLEKGVVGRSMFFNGGTHTPYINVPDYFYQLRKRMDAFINQTKLSDLETVITTNKLRLIDAIFEAQKLAFHYISELNAVLDGRSQTIKNYTFSQPAFDPNAMERLSK